MTHPARTFIQAIACIALAAGAAQAQAQATPSAEREKQLVRMVRQDCGSCHGMHLTGGLGPALTSQALDGKPLAYLSTVITWGLPGTPMPAWQALLKEGEADWIARQLAKGFPQEEKE